MTAKRLSIPATTSWFLATIALWVSLGALTALSSQSPVPRVAIAPSFRWLAILLLAAAALAAVRRLRHQETWLLGLSALVLLPWLPFRIPAVFLVWTGPLRTWIWLAIAVSIAASLVRRAATARRIVCRSAADPRKAPWIAAFAAAMMYLAGAWRIFPHLPAGDEPHYLVITQSLLRDHDLKIENNHRRGDYREYYGGDLRPDYLRRGTDGEIYSIHPIGLPAIIAPVFAAGGYPGVLAFLALVSAAATAITWIVVWRITQDAAAAWFAWAAVSGSAPFFFQAFTVYPDAPASGIVMIGLLALVSDREWPARRLALTGIALAVLPWLHTRFAILEAALVTALLARLAWSRLAVSSPAGTAAAAGPEIRRGLALLAAPVVSAIAWFGFFYFIYGTPNPAAPYNGMTQSEVGNLARGIPGLLFDQQFGLLPNAPVYLCAILGLWTLLRRRFFVALATLLVIVPYAAVVAMYAMWWAGYSPPARFLVPISLPLALPIGLWFSSLRSRSARLLACGSLLLSVLITATMATAGRGALVFNFRDGSSRLLSWMSPLVDVTSGFPSLFRTALPKALIDAAVWLAAIAVVAAAGRRMDRRPVSAPALAVILALAVVVAGSAALSIVWHTNAAQPITLTTGSAALLRAYDPDTSQIAFRYSPFKRLAPADVPPAITIAHTTPHELPAAQPLIWTPYLPAGSYEIQGRVTAPTSGRVTVTMDREFGPAWTWSLEGARGAWRYTFPVPVPARVLLVDADSSTRAALRDVAIRATSVSGNRHRLATEEPLHVVRYGPAVVFLMSGHAYVEPEGTWIGGGDEATFVIAPDPGAPISLFVRNAPVRNQVTLESGAWRHVLSLAPREERLLQVPIDPANAGAVLRVATTAGARPSEVEQSDDRRLLGCWIETR
jgi:hypothetical protein